MYNSNLLVIMTTFIQKPSSNARYIVTKTCATYYSTKINSSQKQSQCQQLIYTLDENKKIEHITN